MILEDLIIKKLLEKKNIILIGESDIWKTYFIENKIIPILKDRRVVFSYFQDCDKLKNTKSSLYIIDEVELLFDRKLLEDIYPEERPYYNDTYLKKVYNWHKNLASIDGVFLCIVTRNSILARKNILDKYKYCEWNNSQVEILEYKKY